MSFPEDAGNPRASVLLRVSLDDDVLAFIIVEVRVTAHDLIGKAAGRGGAKAWLPGAQDTG